MFLIQDKTLINLKRRNETSCQQYVSSMQSYVKYIQFLGFFAKLKTEMKGCDSLFAT